LKNIILIVALMVSGCAHMRFALNNGECPEEFPIKGNADSYRYHLPGTPYYHRTKAESCFATEEAAIKHGYFASKAR
tara:strand:+ start:17 stop:247 length:231 start_codon:yes stop_codon:yes gene_type:complete